MNSFRYGLRNRPASYANVPSGWCDLKPSTVFRHGTIAYDAPLTREQVEGYELTYIPDADEIESYKRRLRVYMNDSRHLKTLKDDLKSGDIEMDYIKIAVFYACRELFPNTFIDVDDFARALLAPEVTP